MFEGAGKLNPNVLRLARITAVHKDRGTVEITYIDAPPGRVKQIEVPAPTPFASGGWGIMVGPDVETIVVVGKGYNDKPFIVTTVAASAFFNNSLGNVAEATFNAHPFRVPNEGDIVLQSKSNSIIEATNEGDVLLRNTSGDNIVVHDDTRTITQQSLQNHIFTESARIISGTVMRDIRNTDAKLVNEGSLLDRVKDPSYNQLLQSIGRNPLVPTMHLARGEFKRNPALAETREVFYEFADSFNVDTEVVFNKEVYQPPASEGRKSTRSNVLSSNRNEVLETVKGTLVDVNGQILDLNKIPIEFSEDDTKTDLTQKLYRSIAFHMGFNSRKDGISTHDPLRDSKLFVDVDKEGQVKINIPSSSRLGNIPRIIDHERHDNDPKTNKELDERSVIPSTIDQDSGHTWHNMVNTGRAMLYAGTELETQIIGFDQHTQFTPPEDAEIESSPVTNISDDNYLAAGHSLHLKMDGAFIHSIGRNAQDQISYLLDTSGKIVQHIGTDSIGRSLVSQYDGSIRTYVGSSGVLESPILEPSTRLSSMCPDVLGKINDEEVPFITELGGPDNSVRFGTAGSVEIFLGSDIADLKSLVLQTEGLLALNLGGNGTHSLALHARDGIAMQVGLGGSGEDQRSIDIQTSGPFLINVGGGDQTFIDGQKNETPGRFDVRVEGAVGGTASTGAHRFVMANTGILLSSDGNITLDTRGQKGTGQIVAFAEKEIHLEATTAGIVLKANGISNEAAGIVIDASAGIILRSGPNHIQISPAGIMISSIPIISPPSSPDTAPAEGATSEIER